MIKLSPAEGAKTASNYLRGQIAADLASDSPEFSKGSIGLIKFHGLYQQDDRDVRKTGPKAFSCMVRVSIPGGQVTPAQYLALDALADPCGDGTLRITSRQGIQYHYVGKKNLKKLIGSINHAGLNTWAACGDVVRNVVGPAEPDHGRDLTPYIRLLGSALKPRTDAYCEIWMDGEKAVSFEADTGAAGGDEVEPLYGATYLPRKFKIGFSRTGDNTTDIYSNDLGFVAHYDAGGALEGFTLLAGGGLGQSNGVKLSHPRVASEICFITPEELLDAAKAVVGVHRDYGNRENRKIARLKYVLDDKGVDWFREELAKRMGRALTPPRPLTWTRHMDYLGWHAETPSTKFFGLRVVNGRIKGAERAAIREIVETLRLNVTFTVQQNLVFTGIAPVDEPKLEGILRKHGVALPHELPPVLRHSMACPALPTCGQAITESERTSPQLIAKLEAELAAVGLPQEVIHVRMTGCPNGCARPYTAEIGIVGQSVNMYSLYLGGSPMATRLAPLYKHGIKEEEIPGTLRPFFAEFAAERQAGESFGDFFFRKHANG